MVTDTKERAICQICGYRIVDFATRDGKRYLKKECVTCKRERLNLPKYYGKAALSPRQRLTGLDRLSFSICSKCGWFGHCDVHHKDANRDNNNPENFEVLCPNCHTDGHLGKPDITL